MLVSSLESVVTVRRTPRARRRAPDRAGAVATKLAVTPVPGVGVPDGVGVGVGVGVGDGVGVGVGLGEGVGVGVGAPGAVRLSVTAPPLAKGAVWAAWTPPTRKLTVAPAAAQRACWVLELTDRK